MSAIFARVSCKSPMSSSMFSMSASAAPKSLCSPPRLVFMAMMARSLLCLSVVTVCWMFCTCGWIAATCCDRPVTTFKPVIGFVAILYT